MTPIGYILSLIAAVLCAVCVGYGMGRRGRRPLRNSSDSSGHLSGATPSAAVGGSSQGTKGSSGGALSEDELQLRKEKQLQRDFEIISGYNLYQALERRSDR